MSIIVLFVHIAVVLYSFSRLVIPPGRAPEVMPSDLLFRKYMLKPNSKLHILFLRKNRWMNLLHIKQNAAIAALVWAYSLINTALCVLGVLYGSRGRSFTAWEISSIAVMLAYGLAVLLIHLGLKKEAKALFLEECEMSEKEVALLKDEISSLVPGFYDPYKIKGVN